MGIFSRSQEVVKRLAAKQAAIKGFPFSANAVIVNSAVRKQVQEANDQANKAVQKAIDQVNKARIQAAQQAAAQQPVQPIRQAIFSSTIEREDRCGRGRR